MLTHTTFPSRSYLSWSYRFKHFVVAALACLSALSLSACTTSVQTFVPESTPPADPVITTARAIDSFYGHMLKVRSKDRTYDQYRDGYVEIDTAIRSLIFRARIGQYNEAAKKTLDEVLEKWEKYRGLHEEYDTYKTQLAKTNRARFARLLSEVITGREQIAPSWLD